MTNFCLNCARNSLIVIAFSVIEALNASGNGLIHDHDTHAIWSLPSFYFPFIIRVLSSVRGGGESTLNVRSRSMITRTIKRFFCHDLKLESFSIGIELMLTIILAVNIIEQRITNKQNKLILVIKQNEFK